jgi:hypothetical protein
MWLRATALALTLCLLALPPAAFSPLRVPAPAAAAAARGAPAGAPRPPPACAPQLAPPVEGTWSRGAAAGELAWAPRAPCAHRVGSREAFLRAFRGRRLAFAGDSQVREFVYDNVRHLARCGGGDGVADAPPCGVVAHAQSYPTAPVEFGLDAGGGENATIVFQWFAYATEALRDEAQLLPRLLRGAERADGLLLSFGHWSLIFDAPGATTRRTDSLAGAEALERDAPALGAALGAAAAARPGLLRRFVWREMYPDEVDAAPHPQHRKRHIMPEFRARARAALRGIFAPLAAAVWDLTPMLDVRAGNVTRPWNENFLTYDGMHLHRVVNVEAAWYLWSFWAAAIEADAGTGASSAAPAQG